MKYLLLAGANPNLSRTEGTSPLYGAAENGHIECVNTLLNDTRTNVLAEREFDKVTALDIAKRRCNTNYLK